MKKLLLLVFLLAAGAVSGQEFTFMGLPWGATQEQVIAVLGQPEYINPEGHYFLYSASIGGYVAMLYVSFVNNGICEASYRISRTISGLNPSQLQSAYLTLFGQLEKTYGAYSEIIIDIDCRITAWHFNNFHVIITTIDRNNYIYIEYFSNSAWNNFEEERIIENNLSRYPNHQL